MTSIIATIGQLVSAVPGWVTTTLGVFTAEGNEVLLFSLVVGFIGIGVGLVKRLLSVRA